MVDEDPPAGTSRRALLARGAAAASASTIALAGCGGRHRHHLRAAIPAQESPLVGQLLAALDLERRTVAAYAASVPLLPRRARDAAKRFLDFELSHEGEIGGLIVQAGTKPPRAPAAYDLGQPRTAREVLVLLHDLERQQLAMYLSMVPGLADGKTRSAITAVLGSDAQHLAVLSELLGLDPLSSAIL